MRGAGASRERKRERKMMAREETQFCQVVRRFVRVVPVIVFLEKRGSAASPAQQHQGVSPHTSRHPYSARGWRRTLERTASSDADFERTEHLHCDLPPSDCRPPF